LLLLGCRILRDIMYWVLLLLLFLAIRSYILILIMIIFVAIIDFGTFTR
jgi:hypothetical protein